MFLELLQIGKTKGTSVILGLAPTTVGQGQTGWLVAISCLSVEGDLARPIGVSSETGSARKEEGAGMLAGTGSVHRATWKPP